MAIKKSKTPAAQQPTDKTRTLWLAGLGAMSIAQKRGGALLSGLIAEGHDVQTRTQKFVQQVTAQTKAHAADAVAPFRAGIKRNVKRLGEVAQQGIAGALAVLGIPSKSDIEELTQRVAALSKQLKTAR